MRRRTNGHILQWFRRRPGPKPEDYQRMPTVERTVQGDRPRQRPIDQPIPQATAHQADGMYYEAEIGRVNAELVRPYLGRDLCAPWNGYDREKLLVAWLARTVQTRLYIHECSKRYCLQNRSSCRFFYPWPLQPQQQFDENTERVACQRRLPEDDRWVVPHNLEMAMFSPATVNVLPFDPEHGADQARQYVSMRPRMESKTRAV